METTLPDWSSVLLSELHEADQRAQLIAGGLLLEQLSWKPRQDTWSIGQCLEHLLLFNEVYLPAISASLDRGKKHAVHQIDPGWLGGWFIRNYVEPSPRGKRANAPKQVIPAEHSKPDILESLLRSNENARDIVRRASEYDVNRIRFKNPFLPIRFRVGTGLEIVCKHQFRHFMQAERVRQHGDFPR